MARPPTTKSSAAPLVVTEMVGGRFCGVGALAFGVFDHAVDGLPRAMPSVRNDVRRIAKTGSVRVTEQFTVGRISPMMHLCPRSSTGHRA